MRRQRAWYGSRPEPCYHLLIGHLVCGPCQRRSSRSATECTWSASSRLHTSNSHIRRLQDRIAALESGHEAQNHFQITAIDDEPHTLVRTRIRERDERPSGVAGSIGPDDDVPFARSTEDIAQVDDSSPVYTVIGPTMREENREGFFGSSSAGTFMQNVSQMVEQRLHGTTSSRMAFLSPPGGPPDEQRTPPNRLRSKSAPCGQEEVSLPLRRTADELMQVYWSYFHPTFPVLDEVQMQETYENTWTGKDEASDQRSFLCLLNTVLAISSQLDPATKPQDRARLADRYYGRAQALIDIFQRGSLQTVQALLLLSMYCQSSSNVHQCWIFMGLAIRVAQGLGLHSAQTSERTTDTRTRELYRRVWHGCLLLDQIVSSTCGRPCAVGPRNAGVVPLPSSIPGSTEEVVIQHFNQSIKLCRILHETIYSLCSPSVSRVQSLDELYDQYFRHDPQDSRKPSVFDVERDLKVWHESIPEYLDLEKMGSVSHNETTSEQVFLRRRLAVMLQQKYEAPTTAVSNLARVLTLSQLPFGPHAFPSAFFVCCCDIRAQLSLRIDCCLFDIPSTQHLTTVRNCLRRSGSRVDLASPYRARKEHSWRRQHFNLVV